MKNSTIAIIILVAIVLYLFYKQEKETKQPQKSKCQLIDEILQKNNEFISQLTAQFNLTEPDLTWLKQKSTVELEDLLKLSKEKFAEKVKEATFLVTHE